MQIGGNYHSNYDSYANQYHNATAHTHHFTECLHEEPLSKKKEGGDFAVSGVTLEIQGNAANPNPEEVVLQMQTQRSSLGKRILGFMQGIWNGMGEKENNRQNLPEVSEREEGISQKGILRGVNAVVSAFKQGFAIHVTEKIETVREKIKVGIHTALKRFGKDSNPFGALTDPGTGSLFDRRAGGDMRRQDKRAHTRRKNAKEVPAIKQSEEHLMDSYSKSGTYCKLNENLTYQQGRAPYKVSDKGEQVR